MAWMALSGVTVVSVRSTRRLVAWTAVMSRVVGSMVTSMSLSTRPNELALVTGTRRPVALASPVVRALEDTTPAVLVTSTVPAEQL